MKKGKKIILLLIFCLFQILTFAQTGDLSLANEYVQQGDYTKAKEVYKSILKKSKSQEVIYPGYLMTLKALKEYDEAQSYLKKLMKKREDQIQYKIEYGLIYTEKGNEAEAKKYFSKFFNEIKGNQMVVENTGRILTERNQLTLAEELYIQARNAGTGKYSFELANLYNLQNNKLKMLDELLETLELNFMVVDQVQNMLQNYVSSPEEYEQLDKILLSKVQRNPDKLVYNELLVWSNIQQKNFYGAFIQARALDKKTKSEGAKCMEVGLIAMNNKEFDTARDVFDYVAKEYSKGQYGLIANVNLIKAKEEIVKSTYPVNIENIKSLVQDYRSLLDKNPQDPQALVSSRNMALLYGYYLDKPDSALIILEKAISGPRVDNRFVSQCKLDMGDIYLFKEEPWEATLLYSQVEKREKDQPLGHEAKLKNAKLNYYKGDFELAQEHLDVLKLATSREIANDAMDLSLLIQNNIALDSNTSAMKTYAEADLLLFQNKDVKALQKLDQLLKEYPNHSLTDDVYMQKAYVYERTGDYKSALENLELVIKNFSYDVNGDKALYKAANLYEEKAEDKQKAMQYYEKLMKDYPGSIFTVDARKRYRKLRGDVVN